MKMTITVDNLTTDRMLRFASALELAGLLQAEDAEVELSGDADELSPLVAATEQLADELTLQAFQQDASEESPEPSHFETDETQETAERPSYEEAHQMVLPLLGSTHSSRLLPLAAAARLLNITSERLWSLCDSGAIEAVTVVSESGYTFRYLTPEQVQILELALTRLTTQGRAKLSRTFLREVARDWLVTHPQYAEAYWAHVPNRGALYAAISYDRRRWHASRHATRRVA